MPCLRKLRRSSPSTEYDGEGVSVAGTPCADSTHWQWRPNWHSLTGWHALSHRMVLRSPAVGYTQCSSTVLALVADASRHQLAAIVAAVAMHTYRTCRRPSVSFVLPEQGGQVQPDNQALCCPCSAAFQTWQV